MDILYKYQTRPMLLWYWLLTHIMASAQNLLTRHNDSVFPVSADRHLRARRYWTEKRLHVQNGSPARSTGMVNFRVQGTRPSRWRRDTWVGGFDVITCSYRIRITEGNPTHDAQTD